MTCVGSKVRIWAYKRNDDYMYVTPFYPPGDGLSEIGECAEYSTYGKELLKVLEHIKKNPIPDEAIFLTHNRRDHLSLRFPIHGTTERSPSYLPLRHTRRRMQAPDYGSVSRTQAADAYQGMLYPNQSYEITVERFEGRTYKCHSVVDEARVNAPQGGCGQCTILFPETGKSNNHVTGKFHAELQQLALYGFSRFPQN
ncbi:hypothetical protein V8C37DRAFT_415282 [Trichoderma ceciliae]